MQSSTFTFSANPNSSAIKGMAYTEDGGALVLIMDSGSTLLYTGVPKAKATGLLAAESVGSYYNKEIRNKYPYLRAGMQHQAEIRIEETAETDLGSRNTQMTQYLQNLTERGLSGENIKIEANLFNSKLQPPLAQSEVDMLVSNAFKK